MEMSDSKYEAFLLRIWRIDDLTQSVWRVSLQRPGQEECLYFATIEALHLYLMTHFPNQELGETDG